MRIVGGEYRGRSLSSPKGQATRPTSDRAREAVFNILQHAGWRPRADILSGAQVLDVFAGTGALGLEALSQGAEHAVFIERDYAAASVCQENIRALGVGDRAQLLNFDASRPTPRPPYIVPRDLIFLDPPYGKDLGATALEGLARQGWLMPDSVCVLEMGRRQPETPPQGFTLLDTRTYGIAQVMFLLWPGQSGSGAA